ncbi:MAG TPA: MMPL family transporter, partial [Puia sp.]|nr:MMPL family transporter [Puia sp.]
MWEHIARFVLKFRLAFLLILLAATGYMGYHATKVQMSYDFIRAIPTDHPKYIIYQAFRQKFGEDGNLLVIGIETDKLFKKEVFNDYTLLNEQIKKIPGVEELISIPYAINLVKNENLEKMQSVRVFADHYADQSALDSSRRIFFNLPFYRGLLYNAHTNAYLLGININKNIMNSPKRNAVVAEIVRAGKDFGEREHLDMHFSGLPLIRTNMATKIATEMKWFLFGSVILSALILFLFFRSFSTMLLSLGVVIIGVVFSMGTMDLFGYKITILNALIPPLIVVIGIPNCIYFLNKYHTSFREKGDKNQALFEMIRRMGIITLFCNISAAIGFGVFSFTSSAILKEFGVIAGINIMLLFIISVILIPAILSYLPDPRAMHMRYLTNRWLMTILDGIERWALNHKSLIYGITTIVVAIAVAGIFRLHSVGYLVDDLPKTDPIYKDLKFFEENFKGVMPLEIIVDTKRKRGLRVNMLQNFEKINQLSDFIASDPSMGHPLSVVEGLKFVRQAY